MGPCSCKYYIRVGIIRDDSARVGFSASVFPHSFSGFSLGIFYFPRVVFPGGSFLDVVLVVGLPVDFPGFRQCLGGGGC